MVSETLFGFAKHLSKVFDLDESKVRFSSKENLFYNLKNNFESLSFPLLCFYIENIRPFSSKTGFSGLNLDSTKSRLSGYLFFPIYIDIGLVYLTSTLEEYFNGITSYYSLLSEDKSKFEFEFVDIEMDNRDIIVSGVLNVSELSTLPTGKESFDFQTGDYYSFTSSLTIESFLIQRRDKTVIRTIKTNLKTI